LSLRPIDGRRRTEDDVLGNRALTRFDYCIIGSGAGGASAAHVLTAAGKNVLILEAGHNPYPGLDRPGPLPPTRHGSDELKYYVRSYLDQQALLEPRTFRQDDGSEGTIENDVNLLPKVVGGAFQHSGAAVPRFNVVDFRLKSTIDRLIADTPGLAVPGFGADSSSANFADWPYAYADLEPYYGEAELLYGAQGTTDNPFASWRSNPYPMAPGVPMYFNLLLADGARRTDLQGVVLSPHTFPQTVNSEYRDGRPPCIDCGWCNGFGCPNHAKGTPPVTTLRRALLSGRCQLRCNASVVRLQSRGGEVSGVEYVDGEGRHQVARADAYVLAASAIESAKLCLLSDPDGDGLGNSSGQVGRNLMFHFQTIVTGFLPQRIHGQRGRVNTHAMSDFRGVEPGGEAIRLFDVGGVKHAFLGGICEFSGSQSLPITEDGSVYTLQLPAAFGTRYGAPLKNALRDLPLGQHLFGLVMQAEDAPQLTNRVDLDHRYRDVFGLPIARITYRNHPYELSARAFYVPYMREVVRNSGARAISINGVDTYAFTAPCSPAAVGPPVTRHVFGTLRMGDDPATSVVDPHGRFHDVANLYAVDGSIFPTISGYNPTLTLIAASLRIAHGLAGTAPEAA
jgi:choline dehydrogenase-like flavoprotein